MSAFKVPRKTIQFAREAVQELEELATGFFTQRIRPPKFLPSGPYEIVEYYDPATGKYVYKFKITQQYPAKMERLATEAILNSRHAFDQALFAACIAVDPQLVKHERQLNMPWSTTPNDLKSRIENKGLIPEKLRKVVYDQEPYFAGEKYEGGDDVIRKLAALANAKHSFGFAVNSTAVIQKHPTISGWGVSQIEIVPPGTWNSTADELFIVRTNRKAELGDDYIVHFHIALDEPSPLGDIPAVFLISVFLDKAEAFVDSLEAAARF